ncbi:hypothetical protein PTKIN_Ptkin13bG0267500 [Pterospermum kingtungense]
MPKQASLFFIILLSFLANYGVSANPSDQSNAPAVSPESLPHLLTTEAETLSPTYTSDVETKSNETPSQQTISTLSINAGEPSPTDIQTKGEEILISQELASPPVSVNDPTLETKADENISSSLSPNSNVDNSVLDIRDMDSLSQDNTSLPPSEAIPEAVPPPPSVDVPPVGTVQGETLSSEETKGNDILSLENTYVPSSSPPGVEESISPALASDSVDSTPVLETSDDGSFTQENQSSVPYVNAPAPAEQEITTLDYSSATTPTTETPENVPELINDDSSLPKTAAPAPSEAFSLLPESDPTTVPSNDETFGLGPTSSHNTILPFNYRAEDETVEPYEEEEDSWNGGNGAVAGVLVGACVIGVGGFVYQKRKKDNIRAQYQCLAKRGGV